ncbi:hypothetical protein EVA_09399 [gut metagenome]|uniref:Uncharacterized protein n=1 Tax=gut metagenome TaxID=749906 RepID=J9G6I8_9ZZZZ
MLFCPSSAWAVLKTPAMVCSVLHWQLLVCCPPLV